MRLLKEGVVKILLFSSAILAASVIFGILATLLVYGIQPFGNILLFGVSLVPKEQMDEFLFSFDPDVLRVSETGEPEQEGLRRTFEIEGVKLSPDAVITIEKPGELWKIVDNDRIYSVEIFQDDNIVDVYQYTLDMEVLNDLNDGNISKRILQEFGDKKMPLSHNAVISVEQEGKKWLVSDKSVGRHYNVKREGDRINIYGKLGLIDFLFGKRWNPNAYGEPKYGIIPLAVGSLLATILALSIATPTGIASALFISEKLQGKTRMIVKTLIEILAGIPSVVLGFFGIMFVSFVMTEVFGIRPGLNLFNASLLLAAMSLPTIISVSEDALRAVPNSYREAALALGSHNWQAATRVILPAAKSGIVAALMLGFGRAIGETMAVLMVAGNAPIIPHSLFQPVRTITTTIAIELGEVPFGTSHFYALFTLGLLLFIVTLATNLLAETFLKREKGRFQI